MTTTLTSSPIRLAAIGTGLAMEQLHWPALNRLKDRFTIVAFAERNEESARRFSEYAGVPMSAHHADYQDLLKQGDFDAVCVLLPIPMLYDASRAALQAGKHVLSEKTPGVDLEQGRQFIQLERDFPDQKLLVAENFFYRDDLRLARRLIDEGAIGKVQFMTWRQASQYVPRAQGFSSTPWRQKPQYRGGPHLDGGVHMISQIRLLCGDVRRVHGLALDANSQMGGTSHISLHLDFVSGAAGSYTSLHPEIPVPPDQDRGMRLYGSDGTMLFSNSYGPGARGVTIHRPSADGKGTTAEEHRIEQPDGGYLNEWINFHDALTQDAPILGTVTQSWLNMQIVLHGLDSAETHQVIDLQQDAPVQLAEKALPLWQPHGAKDLFDGLPTKVTSSK